MIQWATYFELRIENPYGVLKQFMKITEYAREGK